MKRALVFLSEQMIEGMLGLPTGVRLRSVRDTWSKNGIDLMLEGDALPDEFEYVPGTVPNSLIAHLELVDGKLVLKL